MKILILCTGNSCRSQMAHGLLASFDKNLYVCSAGVKLEKQVNPLAIKTMQDMGIDISEHKPTLVSEYLNEDWDYVITVCDHANETCPIFTGRVKHRLHMPFRDPSKFEGSNEQIVAEFNDVAKLIKIKFYEFYQAVKTQL